MVKDITYRYCVITVSVWPCIMLTFDLCVSPS